MHSYSGPRGIGMAATALLALLPAGGTAISRAIDQLKSSVMRPIPSVPPRPVPRPDAVWVPDRYVPMPGSSQGALVPGHWERRISDREFYVPPLVVCDPSTGACQMSPAGVRGPAETRSGP